MVVRGANTENHDKFHDSTSLIVKRNALKIPAEEVKASSYWMLGGGEVLR
jgi:hypothetical protein